MSTPINRDTAALIQRGVIKQPGFYGNQELKDSNDNFNKAVDISAGQAGAADVLKNTVAPPNYTRPTTTGTSYILTTLEKQAITNKANEMAAVGVVPYDVLENFFYILATISNQDDLTSIGNTVGVPELSQPRYLQNIRDIVLIPNISNVGYLANGVASVTHRYASQYSGVQQIDQPSQSSIGDVLSAASLGLSLGVIGSSIIGSAYNNDGYDGALSTRPPLSSSAITNSVGSYQSLANGTLPALQIASLVNPAAGVGDLATLAGGVAIGSLLSQSPLGGALGSFGPLGGIVAGLLLSKAGGAAIGGLMSELITGKRIDTSKRANNPMLTPPSYAGKSFFGEGPTALPAVDQVFCKKVGAFGSMSGGNGVVSFGMQNYNSFGGSLSVASVVAKMATGSPEIPDSSTFYGQSIITLISNVSNVLNVQSGSSIEMRRSDNAIPFMLGMSAAMAGETFSPFGSKSFTGGWKLAASAANDIQKVNPQFMQVAKTVL